jgi:hypothetical protein
VSAENLASEFVSEPKWQWVGGMRARTSTGDYVRIIGTADDRLLYADDDGLDRNINVHSCRLEYPTIAGWRPDLHDGATVGAIEFVVCREAKGSAGDPDADPFTVIAEPLLRDLRKYSAKEPS